MSYIKSTLNFVKRNIVLILPLLILAIISRYIYASNSLFNEKYVKSLFEPVNPIFDPAKVLRVSKAVLAFMTGGGLIAFISGLFIIPATYGMINKALDDNKASLKDFSTSLKDNFFKYLAFTVTRLLFWFMFLFVFTLFIIFLLTFMFLPEKQHIILVVSFLIFILLLALFLYILQSLWFCVMLRDNMTAEYGLKKSLKLVYSMLPSFSSIIILINAANLALEAFLYKIVNIPALRPVITGIVPALVQFTLITYFLIMYKDKTKPREDI